ncbi:MAG: hypothetical protein OXM01_02555 [Gemmatimonadota bacterium]|nr:hypothetical protein [Gemmatimonadota bacterium]
MKPIVLSLALALASAAFADEYTPVDWIEVTEDGSVVVRIPGTRTGGSPERCASFGASGLNINGVQYSFGMSKWQRLGEDSEWIDVPGTQRNNQLCGLSPEYQVPGEYRWVIRMRVDFVLKKYASGNTLVVAGDPEEAEDETADEEVGDDTAVEAVSWGFLKSRAAP